MTEALAGADLDGQRVCLVVPDGTRTCPLPLLLGAARDALAGRASEVTVVIALGTHQGMSEDHLARHLGYEPGESEATYPGWRILNHESWLPETFTHLGSIGSDRLAELTGGLMTDVSVDVRINRHVAEADVAIVVGPVFPHEVVGFSGGNKYFFPGVSGQELIDLSHWVGALITSAEMIGTRGVTPVRALINEAATLIPAQRLALCLVVASGTDTLHAAAFGTPEDAWAACAAVSAETHVTYLDHPVKRVLSIMPTKYEDIWTAAKGFYKLEPIVADGGEVIIYAPHITHDLGHASRRSPRSATTTATTSSASGSGSGISRGATWPTPPTSAGRAPGIAERGRAEPGDRHPGHRHPRGRCAGGRTSTTSTRPRSTSPRTRPTPTPSSNPTPARCCTGCGRVVRALPRRGRRSPGARRRYGRLSFTGRVGGSVRGQPEARSAMRSTMSARVTGSSRLAREVFRATMVITKVPSGRCCASRPWATVLGSVRVKRLPSMNRRRVAWPLGHLAAADRVRPAGGDLQVDLRGPARHPVQVKPEGAATAVPEVRALITLGVGVAVTGEVVPVRVEVGADHPGHLEPPGRRRCRPGSGARWCRTAAARSVSQKPGGRPGA